MYYMWMHPCLVKCICGEMLVHYICVNVDTYMRTHACIHMYLFITSLSHLCACVNDTYHLQEHVVAVLR